MLNQVPQTSSSTTTNSSQIPNPKKSNGFVSLLLFVCVGIFLFGAGYRIGGQNSFGANKKMASSDASAVINSPNQSEKNKLNQNSKNVDFGLFWEAWDLFEDNYIDSNKTKKEDLFYGAVKGLVSSANDPYTFFLTPKENKSSKDSLGGRFEGIGAQLGTKNNQIVIISPIKDSPASRAGLRAGDIIKAVDGKSTKGEAITNVVNLIRGPKDTKVTLTIERKGKEQDVEIVRSEIKVQSMEIEYKDKIAHLKLQQFGTSARKEWQTLASEISNKYKSGQITGLILDMRGNPGGLLDACVYIASDFLPYGKLIVKQEGVEESIDYTVQRTPALPDIPLVVLIDEGSASASEILAGAIRDYKRAKIVGQKSFGKGSVQGTYDLSDGSGMHITVAKWILPNGEWINGKGINPDIEVVNPDVDTKNTVDTKDHDLQLQKAEELLKK
jgi:carboxyl-terminal processing protease